MRQNTVCSLVSTHRSQIGSRNFRLIRKNSKIIKKPRRHWIFHCSRIIMFILKNRS